MKKYNIRDKRFIVLFMVFYICSALNAFSTEKISPVVINKVTTIVKFQSGKPAYIVTGAGTVLEKRITQRLSVYLSKVLGSPTRIVSDLKAVPAKAPAIILSSNQKTSFGIVAPKTSPEGFALASKIINSHSVIIAAGNTELGIKTGGATVNIKK
jgi:hypothetical protein